MKIQERFGITIRSLRKIKQVSQECLAYETGIDRTYISDIENGTRKISIEIIERLANYFEMPISELFRKVEEYGNFE
mgnify:CR=1 FL=1